MGIPRAGALFVALLVIGAWTNGAGAAEFTADLVLKQPGREMTLRLHVKGHVYRLDGEEDGRRRIVITDTVADSALLIDPAAKTYEVVKGYQIARFDPILSWELTKSQLTKAEGGTEEIDGRSCKRFTYTNPAQEGFALDVWHAEDLDHFVKQVMEISGQKREMLLTNVKVEPVDAALMQAPEGYQRKKSPEEIEAALPSLSEALEVRSPVGRRVSTGGELRVKVDPSRVVTVVVESRTAEEAILSVLPFHGGAQRENIGVSPWKFARKGEGRNRNFNDNLKLHGATFQVDEVRIRVEKGLFTVKVEQSGVDGRDQYLFGGKSVWGQVETSKGLTLTVTGDNQAGDVSAGTLVVSTGAVKETEDFTLENGKSRTWTYGTDKGVTGFNLKVALGKGGLKVRTR